MLARPCIFKPCLANIYLATDEMAMVHFSTYALNRLQLRASCQIKCEIFLIALFVCVFNFREYKIINPFSVFRDFTTYMRRIFINKKSFAIIKSLMTFSLYIRRTHRSLFMYAHCAVLTHDKKN